MLDLMLALPNAFHTSSHLLAHLCALSPHRILVLHDIPRKWCYSSAWVMFLAGRVEPAPTPAPYKGRDWPVMP